MYVQFLCQYHPLFLTIYQYPTHQLINPLPLPPIPPLLSVQLVFEVVLGSGFMGDVAIDDVLVASGGCALQPAEASNGVNYTTPVLPTLEPPSTDAPALPYDCSFDENDLCDWTSSAGEVSRVKVCRYLGDVLPIIYVDVKMWIVCCFYVFIRESFFRVQETRCCGRWLPISIQVSFCGIRYFLHFDRALLKKS